MDRRDGADPLDCTLQQKLWAEAEAPYRGIRASSNIFRGNVSVSLKDSRQAWLLSDLLLWRPQFRQGLGHVCTVIQSPSCTWVAWRTDVGVRVLSVL
jgi:hypothetical protein